MFRPEYSEIGRRKGRGLRPGAVCRGTLMLVLLGGVLAGISGCVSWDQMMSNLRGSGFEHNEDSECMAKMRGQEDAGNLWSFSTKAQQIERSFGS